MRLKAKDDVRFGPPWRTSGRYLSTRKTSKIESVPVTGRKRSLVDYSVVDVVCGVHDPDGTDHRNGTGWEKGPMCKNGYYPVAPTK